MLKDALYHIFVYPLESLLSFVLSLLYGYCGSHGLSIIFLSLLVNLFLLKLFFIADRASKNHSLIKSKLDIKIAEFKQVFKGGELYAYIKTLYRQNHYHPIYALKALGGLALQVPFFVAVVSLLEFHSPELKGIGFGVIPDLLSPDGLLGGINFLPLLMTFFTLCNVWISSSERGARIQGSVIALIFLVLLYKMPSALLLYWTTSMIFALLKSVCVKYIQLTLKEEKESKKESQTFFSKIFNACFTKYADLSPQDYKLYRNISIFAILNLCILIFLYNPFALYASDVSQFDPKETWNTLGALFGFFLLTSFLLIYSTSFFYRTRLLKIGTYGFCVTLLLAIVFNFVIIADYGPMDAFVFLNPIPPRKDVAFLNQYLYDMYIVYVVYIGIALSIMLMAYFFLLYLAKVVEKSVKITCITLLFLSSFSFVCVFLKMYEQEKNSNYKNSNKVFNTSNDIDPSLFSFALKKKNILVVLLDGFVGSHFGQLITSFPEIKKMMDGFIYYNNTISVGAYTRTSIYGVVGGDYYSPVQINARNMGSNLSLEKELLESYITINDILEKNGFSTTWSSIQTERYKKMISKRKISEFSFDFGDFYKTKYNLDNVRNNEVGILISYGIFNVFPIRSKIYRNGMWLWNSNYNVFINTFSSRISPFEVFVDFVNTNSQKSVFRYIHTSMTHRPFGFDANTCMPSIKPNVLRIPNNNRLSPSLVPNNPYSIEMQYTASYCNLVMIEKMLNKMKELDIYDNTLIIFVSDHGDSIYTSFDLPSPIAPPQRFDAADALLLVKMPNQRGELKIDHHLMSNADVPVFFCSILEGGCPNVPAIKDIIRDNREVFFTIMRGHDLHQQKEDSYILDHVWKVKQDRKKIENWVDVTEEARKNPRVLIQNMEVKK